MDRARSAGHDLGVVQERLLSASLVFDDPSAYAAGVQDALTACRWLFETTRRHAPDGQRLGADRTVSGVSA